VEWHSALLHSEIKRGFLLPRDLDYTSEGA
jgi:hypothetical protein